MLNHLPAFLSPGIYSVGVIHSLVGEVIQCEDISRIRRIKHHHLTRTLKSLISLT